MLSILFNSWKSCAGAYMVVHRIQSRKNECEKNIDMLMALSFSYLPREISIYNILNLRPNCGIMSYWHVRWSIILPNQLLLEAAVILYFNSLPHQPFYFSSSTLLILFSCFLFLTLQHSLLFLLFTLHQHIHSMINQWSSNLRISFLNPPFFTLTKFQSL